MPTASACRRQSFSQTRSNWSCRATANTGILPRKRATPAPPYFPDGCLCLYPTAWAYRSWIPRDGTPNAQRELARIDHRLRWDEAFREYLKELDRKKPVVACGDLNCAFQPIDLARPKANEGNAGYSIQERESFGRLLDAGFVDSFRFLHPDAKEYSWWSYMGQARQKNIGWRIDYFLVSDSAKANIRQARIHPEIFGSDHCPVSLEIDF